MMISSQAAMPLKVFISYSHQNITIKTELERYLSSHLSDVELLSDNLVPPGADWLQSLTQMRNEADVFVLLVSDAYLQSKTVNEIEKPQVMARAEKGSVYMLPFVLERCDWRSAEYARYQMLPKFAKPLAEFEVKEEAYKQLADALASISFFKQNNKAAQIIKQEMEKQTGILKLAKCNLSVIPRELLDMDWLTEIELDKNNIQKIENLDNLVKLQKLSITGNKIENIENLEALEQLCFLDLKNNLLTEIVQLEHNINLQTLGLSSNRITSLQGISQLFQLTTLYAAHNLLTGVEELANMPQLKRIVLTNNQIGSLKPLLPLIRSGLKVALQYSYNAEEEGIFIKDNKTLSEPSVEVIEKGREAVLKYFDDADLYGTRKLEVVKLILVGNSKVGKTNLSEYLRGIAISKTHNSTHMLNIQSIKINFKEKDNPNRMQVNIFDFGGQDYYHDSHRLYYSHDTAYILMWDTTTNKYSEEAEDGKTPEEHFVYENYPLEYWLESITYNLANKYRYTYGKNTDKEQKHTANNPPVLILQNKIDIEEGRLDQQSLCARYPNIAAFFNISLLAEKRTSVLPDVLNDYMNALNLSGRQLINYEYKVVEDFVMHPRAFSVMTLDEFWKECTRIIADDSITFNKDNARIIASILNSIGIIFYARQNEDDGIIFTQITRLNDLIIEVMDTAKNGNDKGIFRKDQVGHIPYKEEILTLLIQNKSIIATSDTDFLVPQFLPMQPDPTIDFFLTAFHYTEVRFIYKAYFHKTLLLSLFSRYVQESIPGGGSAMKAPLFWRNGIIIQRGDKASRQMVFVEFIKTEKHGIINIKTTKPYNKRGLEREIEAMLDDLNKGWTVCKEISANSTDYFELDMLKEQIGKGIFEFSADGQIFSANDFKHIADFEKLPRKLFLSYSSKNAAFTKRFVTHLEVLKAAKLIEPWYDRMIESGTRWDDSIRREMKTSDVVIFMLSPDFLATDYIMKTELPLAIEQMQSDAKFFFIELQPCGWKRTVIKDYQQTDNPNETSKNVILIGEPDNDKKWNEVIDELVSKIKPR